MRCAPGRSVWNRATSNTPGQPGNSPTPSVTQKAAWNAACRRPSTPVYSSHRATAGHRTTGIHFTNAPTASNTPPQAYLPLSTRATDRRLGSAMRVSTVQDPLTTTSSGFRKNSRAALSPARRRRTRAIARSDNHRGSLKATRKVHG